MKIINGNMTNIKIEGLISILKRHGYLKNSQFDE